MKRLLAAAVVTAGTLVLCIFMPVASANNPSNSKVAVTFNKDVAPIFYKNCAQCHRPGEVAPMSLMTYKDARPWARSIREKVATQQMPPGLADPHYGEFSNDRRLTQDQIDIVTAWVDQGAKEGDPKDLPAQPEFADGWNIGKPDAVFYLPQEYSVPASGVVEYKYFNVPTNFTEDRWIQAAEIRPGNRAVVHHIIVFAQKGADRRLLVGYAPGEQPAILGPGLGRKIPAGSDLVFQVHYTPNGTAATDRSFVGLVFCKTPPNQEILTRPVLNARFAIPPGDSDYKVESSYTFPEDAHIYSLMPHMHLRGKDFIYRVTFPDGTSKVILSVPHYDFSWQSYYILKEPVAAPKGTRLDCVAHFDNSEQNKYNPDPKKEVRWGDQTWEEMMIGWTSYTLDHPRAGVEHDMWQ
ncbi:MAG TPA: thiol-disulfide isomerase [Blastocatellia bacterium]